MRFSNRPFHAPFAPPPTGADSDDNAFTDCAIAAHADFVITEDHHFNLLANAGYKPQPITPSAFIDRYRGLYF